MLSELQLLKLRQKISNNHNNINKLLSNEFELGKEDYYQAVIWVLTKFRWIHKYANLNLIEDEELIKSIIKEVPSIIRHIPNQPEELCMLALESHYKPQSLFRYSILPEYQTDKICLYAVSKCGMVLNRVVRQTDEICLAAVKQSGLSLKYVKNKTDEICVEAIKQNPNAIKYIDNVTPNIYIGSVVGKIQELDKYISDNKQLKILEETIIRMILAMKK